MSVSFNRTQGSIDPLALARALHAGSRRALARAITLAESTRAEHRQVVDQLLSLLPSTVSDTSLRVGVSGAPGVGKSTFIEALGLAAIAAGRRLAVLAVDPSSSLSGGSILGDKTRMPELSINADAFIRPSPAGTMLGGVTRRTRESMLFCEAAGFDLILVETVGVGQSEVAVSQMTDLFLLLLAPGGGDDLQGIKRGIMELTDITLVTKSDGDLRAAAGRAVSDCANALRLMRARSTLWQPVVQSCSAVNGEGMREALELIWQYEKLMRDSSQLNERRQGQLRAWLQSEITEQLIERFRNDEAVRRAWQTLEAQVMRGAVPATNAAQRIVSEFLDKGTTQ